MCARTHVSMYNMCVLDICIYVYVRVQVFVVCVPASGSGSGCANAKIPYSGKRTFAKETINEG